MKDENYSYIFNKEPFNNKYSLATNSGYVELGLAKYSLKDETFELHLKAIKRISPDSPMLFMRDGELIIEWVYALPDRYVCLGIMEDGAAYSYYQGKAKTHEWRIWIRSLRYASIRGEYLYSPTEKLINTNLLGGA